MLRVAASKDPEKVKEFSHICNIIKSMVEVPVISESEKRVKLLTVCVKHEAI